MTTDTAHTDRVDHLRLELRAAAEKFAARIRDAEPAAAELADLEGQLRAAENLVGLHEYRPSARELAAEVVTGLLHALQPYLRPLTSRAAALRASDELTTR